MTSRPRLHPQYRAVIVEGRGALLLSDQGDRALDGRLFERLIPLIDGETSPADLAIRLEREHAPAEVFYTLSLLETQGLLTSESAEAPTIGAPASASERFSVVARIVALGALPAGECRTALERLGVGDAESASFALVLTDSYLRPDIATLDAEVRAGGGLWMPARPAREGTWIGPVFGRETGPCWHCLEHRLSRNRPFEYHLMRRLEGVRPLGSTIPAGDALDAAMAVVAGACAAAIQRPDTAGLADAILVVDQPSGARSRHLVARRPQCPACGDRAAYTRLASAPMALRGRPKETAAAEATLTRFGALVDPLTGVVHSAERLTGAGAEDLHVWTASFGTSPARESGSILGCGLRHSAGKGITDAAGRASSLGEAIERYSWAYQGDEPRRCASLEELGADAIHPNACMLFSDAQYASRSAGDRASRRDIVPPPLDPWARIDWTPVWSLTAQARRYLPTMLLYGDYPAPPDLACCVADPSGNAAGDTLEEAVLQGVLELVERDALAIWWYTRVRRQAIALDDAEDPFVRRLVRRYERRGRAVWALDLTTDLGIPAVAAVSRRLSGDPEAILLGFGAHLNPGIALTRALLELTQIDVQIGRAEEEGKALDPTLASWLRNATLAGQPYLEPAPGPATAPAQLPALATADLREDIAICQRAIAGAGIEVLALDLTRPDIGLPVVRMLAPGLRHFRRRLAPGRLYDVPVRLGWLTDQRAEAELNPIPFFL